MAVQAMKTGALEFLTKPFRDRELLDAIHQAIQRDCANRKDQAEIAEQSSGRRCEQRWDYRHSKKSNRVQKTERLSAVLGSVAPKTPLSREREIPGGQIRGSTCGLG